MEIKKITKPELPGAMGLVWEVFQEFEGPDYSQEGIDSFKAHIDRQEKEATIAMFGAFEEDELLGVIATRDEGRHISLFFVSGKHHRQGVGRKLFEQIIPLTDSSFITVNSSPYAVEVYRRLGFSATDDEQLTNGIRYVPMKYEK